MSGADAQDGIARELYLELERRFGGGFEVLAVSFGSPDSFNFMDEYMAVDCEDRSPVIFLNGEKLICGSKDAASVSDCIEALLGS